MQLTLHLIFVTMMTAIDAAMIPRGRQIRTQDVVNDTTTIKMPTIQSVKFSLMPKERLRPSSFPKTVMKFVVTPMPRQYVTDKTTRKPLMKRLLFRNFTINADNLFERHTTQKPAFGAGVKNKRRLNSPNIAMGKNRPDVKKDIQDNKETNFDTTDEEIQTAVYPMNEMENNNAGSKRNSRLKRLLKLDNDSEEYLDWQEYIFVSPSIQMEKKQASIEVSDEYITTENPLKPGFPRIKRSNNVIEEENLGTTVAGYKFTWHDTRLTNNLVFKNIHS